MEVGQVQRVVLSVITESHVLELDAIFGADISPERSVEGQSSILILAYESAYEGGIDIHHCQMEDRRQLDHVERRTAFLLQLAVQSGNLLLETGNLLLELFTFALRGRS